MICAAESNRNLVYFTFHDVSTYENLKKIQKLIEERKLTVSQVYELILEYLNEIQALKSAQIKLFGIAQFLDTKFSN
jgi:hypothetical protein